MLSNLRHLRTGGIRQQRFLGTMSGSRLVLDHNYASQRTYARKSTQSAKDFMLSGGTGVYTAMRTVCHGRRLFLLDDHMQRLSNSYNMVLGDGAGQRTDAQYWRQLLVPLLRQGLDALGRQSESKITVLVGTKDVRLQFEPLNGPGRDACWVRFVGGKRDHPEAKSLDWVHEREALERLIVPPINEVVLVDDVAARKGHSRFYEGTSSNFFATRRIAADRSPEYRNYELLSAPLDSVLLGTVMKLVLRICERDGVAVSYDPAVDLAGWSGAFVSSTSRLVLPAAGIFYGDQGQLSHELDAHNPLVAHLQAGVRQMTQDQSVEI